MLKIIYSPNYYVDIGIHVLPMEKYELIIKELIKEKIILPDEIIEPQPASKEDLLLAHSKEYIDEFEGLCPRTERTRSSELPLRKDIVDAFKLSTGGTIMAAHTALKYGIAINIGGGFHHAFSDRAEGFCYINDIAVAIKKCLSDGLIKKAAVIDCDLHQGNGTAVIFQNNKDVFTFSIHQQDLYPDKEKSDLDIGLEANTDDEGYLPFLKNALLKIFNDFKPQLIIYQAGADPFMGDQLGSLKLSFEGLKQRDRLVIGECVRNNVPCAVTLGGGYAYNTSDTVKIHVNTCKVANEFLVMVQK